MKKILIITSSFDKTVDYIVEKYNQTALFFRFNVDCFDCYNIVICNSGWEISCKQWKIQKNELYSIYYRKPVLPRLEGFYPRYRAMIAKDILSIVNGIADAFEGKVLTKPFSLRRAENKVCQLLYASEHSFLIPDSCIGNDMSYVAQIDGEKIIKPIAVGKVVHEKNIEIYPTMFFRPINESVAQTPIYIQKYICKKYEARLTFINGKMFAVRIDSEDKVDWRRNYAGNKYCEIEVPQNIIRNCINMMSDFDIIFGAFDFIINNRDEWIFLEVNPNGQWLWLECALEIPISNEIISYLVG